MTYIIEVNFCLLVLASIYYFFLRNETDFKFRRIYLLLTVFVSFGAPMLKLGGFNFTQWEAINSMPTLLLPEITIGNQLSSTGSQTHIWPSDEYLIMGYWLISTMFLLFFLFKITQIIWFTFSNKARLSKSGNIYLIETQGTLPTFSFFNLLFFDNSIELTDDEYRRIMDHELAHINQGHSIDIIVFELAKVFTWFNPIVWFIRNEIQDVHEYLADDKVIKETNQEDYSSLLAKMTLNQAHISIGHHFNKSTTLKRLKMMKRMKENVKIWKTLLIIPFFGLTAIIVSCNDETLQDLDNVMQTATQTEVPASLQAKFESLQKEHPEADLVYMELDANSEESMNKLKALDPNSIAHMDVNKNENKIVVILNKNGALKDYANNSDSNGVFTLVDEPAAPVSGFEAYYQTLAKEIKYPVQAKELGIQGRVYVQFIIDENGAMQDISVVKGIGAGCDAEAMRAVAIAGDWKAPMQDGKRVKQRIILPVTFALNDAEALNNNSNERFELEHLDKN